MKHFLLKYFLAKCENVLASRLRHVERKANSVSLSSWRAISLMSSSARSVNLTGPVCCVGIIVSAKIVFALCVAERDVERYPPPHQRTLRTLTQVCHYWREVALAAASLWTTIVITEKSRPEAVEAMLERSGEGLLSVFLTRIRPPHQSFRLTAHQILLLIFEDRLLYLQCQSILLRTTTGIARTIHLLP